MKQGIILAAGLGSRLSEITDKTPKSLIKVNGKPILERNIEFMIEAGFDRIILVIGYMKDRFEYLKDKYSDYNLHLIYNEEFATSNTVSSLYKTRKYFDRDTYITTADIYLSINLYKKYRGNYSFYLLRPISRFEKPDWMATLDNNLRFHSVNTSAYEGHSYTGISHWMSEDLQFVHRELEKINWDNPIERKQYWDELILPYLPGFELYAKILENNSEIYEFDDMSDIELFRRQEKIMMEIC